MNTVFVSVNNTLQLNPTERTGTRLGSGNHGASVRPHVLYTIIEFVVYGTATGAAQPTKHSQNTDEWWVWRGVE